MIKNTNPSVIKSVVLGVLLVLLLAIAATTFVRTRSGQTLNYLTEEEQTWLKENNGQLEVLFGYEAPPNAFHNEKGEYVGLLVDFLHEIESHLNISFKFRDFATWDELIEYSKTHQDFIVVGIAQTEDRSEYLAFTDPFIKIPYVIVSRASANYATLDDTIGSTVCTAKNYAVNEYIRQYYPTIIPQEKIDNLEGLRSVSTGQCDVMVLNQTYASYLIEDQGLVNLKVAGESGYQNKLSAAASINDPMLQRILDKAVDQISAERRQELYRQWVSVDTGAIRLSQTTLSALAAGTTVVLGLLAALWLWSVSLRTTVRRQTQQIRDDLNRITVAEASLRKSEEKYRGLIEQSNDAIYLRYNRKYEIVNKKFREMFDLTPEDVNRPDFDLIDLVSLFCRPTVEKQEKLLENGDITAANYEFSAVSKNNKELFVEASVNRIQYEDGLATQGILRDITKRRHLEEQLRQSQKMEAIGRLAGGVAHDFNNMLTVINGQSELIMMRLNEHNNIYKYVQQIHGAGQRAASLTRQLLAFSRKQIIQPEILNINELISETKRMLERLLGEDVELQFIPDPDAGHINADAVQIEQILL